jgi:hypothetical protein
MRLVCSAVAIVALACLLVRAGRLGMAGDYVDPVGKIGAQDEALYAHSAIQMAQHGGWLTPMFMGRYGLYKPPLLAAASGLSARIFGISKLALRLPIALIAALAVGLVFWWGAEFNSPLAGFCAAALLISNHLWHSLASLCMTDGLLAAFYLAALFCLFIDPWLESKAALWGYAGALAAAILTKSIAGVFPLLALGLYWIAAPGKERPRWTRVALAVGLAAGLAAPWFIYQMVVHGRWFWAEHIEIEILGYGAGAPPQTSNESHLSFYASRLVLLDPVLIAMVAPAIVPFLKDLRKRSGPGVLLLIGIVVPALAALFWGYRNASYLLPVIPMLAILAGSYNPLCSGRSGKWALAALVVAFVAKTAMPTAPWGLSFHDGTRVADAPLLTNYCERARGNELVLVDIPDEFFASVLPLPRIHYVLRGASVPGGKYGLDFAEMGIILNTEQFADVAHWTPIFQQRLREWGLDSAEPIGSVVFTATDEDIARLVRAHPESDFLLPERYWRVLAPVAPLNHEMVEPSPDRILLLSRRVVPARPHPWTCRL